MVAENNAFDPPDPEANTDNRIPERGPRKRVRGFADPRPSPAERIAGSFGALGLVDRRDYPGQWLDPETLSQFLGEPGGPGYPIAAGRAPLTEDLFNPLSRALGVRDVALSYEKKALEQMAKKRSEVK